MYYTITYLVKKVWTTFSTSVSIVGIIYFKNEQKNKHLAQKKNQAT